MRVGLLPMGAVPSDVLADLRDALKDYGLAAEILPNAPLPRDALDDRRAQYRAEALLGGVAARVAGDVVAVTAVDLYVEGLNFVFGLANAGANGAVVSIHRLAAADRDLFVGRLVKEVVHELGHTWGLGHCEDASCVMHFSNTLEETDAKAASFCKACGPRLPEPVRVP